MDTNDKLISFLKSQMNTANFKYSIDFAHKYNTDYESQLVWGQVNDLPNEDEKVFPKYINVDNYYSPEYSGMISGTWFNLANPNNYQVEIYILADTYYLKDQCTLNVNGTWKSSKEIPTGFKVIKLVDKTKDTNDSKRFIEYPYSYFANFKMRLYCLTDTEYLNDEVPIFDVGSKKYIFYTNKPTKGLKIGKVIQKVWRDGSFVYDVVAIAGALTNIKNGRLPSSYLIPSDDPSFDKDGSNAKGKYGYLLNSRSWIYDIGLVLLTFTSSGDYDLCKEILNRLTSEQNSDGSFNFSYDNYIGPLFEGYVRTGAVAWLLWGMTYYTIKSEDKSYINVIDKTGSWLLKQIVTDVKDPRYGFLTGGYGTYDDNYIYHDEKITWCSTEHQVSSLQALNGLYQLTNKKEYKKAAENLHYNLIKDLYDYENHRFFQGVNINGVDKSWALDCVTWAGLSTISDEKFGIFNDKLIETALSEYKVSNTRLVTSTIQNRFNKDYSSNLLFSGFKPYSDRDNGYTGSPDIVWSEGTLGFILLCIRAGKSNLASEYTSQIEKLQSASGNSGGILYSTATYSELPWEFHVWECVTSTAWLYLLKNNSDALFPSIEYSTYGNDPELLNKAEKIISGFPLTSNLKAGLNWKNNIVSGSVGPFYLNINAEESSSIEEHKYVQFNILNGTIDLKQIDDAVDNIIKEIGKGKKADFVGVLNDFAAKIQNGSLLVGIAPPISESNGMCGIRVITLSDYNKEIKKNNEVVTAKSSIKVIYDVYINQNYALVMAEEEYKKFTNVLNSMENDYELLQKNIANVVVSFVGIVKSTVDDMQISEGILKGLGMIFLGLSFIVAVSLVFAL